MPRARDRVDTAQARGCGTALVDGDPRVRTWPFRSPKSGSPPCSPWPSVADTGTRSRTGCCGSTTRAQRPRCPKCAPLRNRRGLVARDRSLAPARPYQRPNRRRQLADNASNERPAGRPDSVANSTTETQYGCIAHDQGNAVRQRELGDCPLKLEEPANSGAVAGCDLLGCGDADCGSS